MKTLYLICHYPGEKHVLFDYQKTRSLEGPEGRLKNFNGFLQTDAYTAYNNLGTNGQITQVACMAHAVRLRFAERNICLPDLMMQPIKQP